MSLAVNPRAISGGDVFEAVVEYGKRETMRRGSRVLKARFSSALRFLVLGIVAWLISAVPVDAAETVSPPKTADPENDADKAPPERSKEQKSPKGTEVEEERPSPDEEAGAEGVESPSEEGAEKERPTAPPSSSNETERADGPNSVPNPPSREEVSVRAESDAPSRKESTTAPTSSPAVAALPDGVEASSTESIGNVDENEFMDLSLEELVDVEVWTATKTKSTVLEAPAIITVVTQEDIRMAGYQSVAEVLHHTIGFYVVDDHILPNLGIRGVAGGFMGESGTIKVMIDGHSVAFRSTGGNWLGPELIPLTAIERIEIIRGPASALYGADAFLGVVNIITVKGEDLSLGRVQGGVNVNSSSHVGNDFDMALGTRYGDFEIQLSGRVNREDRSGLTLPDSSPAPAIPPYNQDDPTASGLVLSSQVGHGRFTYHIKNRHLISLVGHISRIDRGGEFGPWSQLSYGLDDDGHPRGTRVSLYQSMVGLQITLVPLDSFSLDWKLSYLNGGPTEKDKIDVESDIYYVRRDFGYDALETSLEGRWQIIDSLTTVLGTEFVYDWENLPSSLHVLRSSMGNLEAGEVAESISIRQGDEEFYNIGAFAHLMWSLLKPYLDLTGGVRYDNHNVYGNQVSGRVGAISNPHRMLHLKLLWGSAFKAPSPLMLYGVPYQVGDIIGNPDLKPQKVHTVEGQALFRPIRYFSLSSGLAYNLLLDRAEFVQQGINRVAVNLSRVKSLSWESEAVASYEEWIRGSLSFELQQTTREFESYDSAYLYQLLGNRNVIYPGYILRFCLSGRIPKVPLRAAVNLMYVDERPSSEMNTLENRSMYYLPDYVLLNASLSTVGIEIIDNRETTVSVWGRNLLNRRVADPGFAGIDYPLSPLTVFVQLRQEL